MFDFLSKKFSSVFSRITGSDRLTEKNIDETLAKIQDALLEADVPYDVVQTFIAQVKKSAIGQKIYASLKPGEQLIKIVHDQLTQFLGGQLGSAGFSFQIPSIIMMMGLQGSGKTTTIGKLCNYSIQEAQKRGKKRSILCASVDFYRPAALDQLEKVVSTVGATFYKAQSTSPVEAVREIVTFFNKGGFDHLFLDTAGRLHIDQAMMEELIAIERIIKPKYKLLVLDSMTGQESLNVAQEFNKALDFNYAILTKIDSDARGGAAFAFKYVLKKPILFLGSGEKAQDLELFFPERMASRILGMGDVLTLLERAQEKIKEDEQASMYASFQKGKLTLQDFADQLSMVAKLGSVSQIAQYFPGGNTITPEMLEKGECEMKKFKAIISSMTVKERLVPSILNDSRKKRIAKGAGVALVDISQLLERFEQSQEMLKMLKKFGRFNSMFR